MTTDEQSFLDAIAARPDDEAVHGAFADWLDENDRPEEAAFQRRWTPEVQKSEDWLRAKAAEYHLFSAFPECIREVIEEGYCHGSGGEEMRDDLRDDNFRADLFEHWQTFSGKRVRLRDVINDSFTCGC
jgi:uncharacterized protein (TIGR02996 family)